MGNDGRSSTFLTTKLKDPGSNLTGSWTFSYQVFPPPLITKFFGCEQEISFAVAPGTGLERLPNSFRMRQLRENCAITLLADDYFDDIITY